MFEDIPDGAVFSARPWVTYSSVYKKIGNRIWRLGVRDLKTGKVSLDNDPLPVGTNYAFDGYEELVVEGETLDLLRYQTQTLRELSPTTQEEERAHPHGTIAFGPSGS